MQRLQLRKIRYGAAMSDGIPPIPLSGPASWLPGLWVLRHYQRAWLAPDLVAGLVLTALLVPAGMGYAQASGLPAVNGLYATIAGLVAYAVFGPSRILVLGPDSALAAMIAAAVVAKAAGDPARAVALSSVLAIMTGVLCAGAAFAKAGFITDLLSKPVRVGYLNGIALTIVVTQLPKLFGFSVAASDVTHGAYGFVRAVLAGETQLAALAIGGGCIALIVVGRTIAPRAPSVLVAVVLATLAVTLLGLDGWLGLGAQLAVVGVVPRGLPLPAFPLVRLDDLDELFIAAAGIALVAFADTSVLSRTLAARARTRVDPNRELLGLGLANLASGLFRGFPTSSSSSRTPVAEAAGSRTQLTGLVSAVIIAVLLVAAPGLVRNLPTTALAAVVITAALRMFDFGALRVFYRVRRADFILSMVAFFAVAALGVLNGIGIAVAVSLLDVVRRAWRPHDAILGRAAGVKGYHDIRRYPEAKQIPGLLLFRWDAPLFFANAETFRTRILTCVDAAATPVKWVVVAAEPITDVDTTAAEALEELDIELAARGAELAFAELKDPVKDRLQQYGIEKRIGREFFFPTVGVAVKTFLSSHPVEWVDWEETSKD